MEKLSAPQQAIYDFMVKFQEEYGYPPSVREICKAVGLRSTSTVHGHLTRLERKGMLRRDPTKPRAIQIVAVQQRRLKQITVPIIGKVTAGVPILAQEDIQGYVSLPNELARDDTTFILEVKGDSMINAGIFDGDQIVVQPDVLVNNGDIIVAMIPEAKSDENGATCKRFFKEDGHVRLQPENPALEPLYVDDVDIVGKVVGLMRFKF